MSPPSPKTIINTCSHIAQKSKTNKCDASKRKKNGSPGAKPKSTDYYILLKTITESKLNYGNEIKKIYY